ncbi:MAG: IclR family transcriptional regulator [Cetobacterium sp.]|uniref:Transcriptional regulator, IclR family n=1 Tax=Cetobacterium ceti TaxID=180163 RepID=A0A1T4N8I0_9FUSO|nr:IclR family transcriptional regulator [Cetobacterium ceti]MCJ8343033.1 IclR family transcriptional regulator [Cetobacterium sp.]SJZ75529.1 transcriptional regulator, IclR family [Cetobacterium ceti]
MEGKLIQSVQRAIDIINCFTEEDHELSLKDISEKVNLSKSTVHGILSTLLKNSFIEQNPLSSYYSLGPAFMEKSFLINEDLLLKNLGRKYLEEISQKFSVTANIFSYKNKHLHLIDRVTSPNLYYSISTSVKKIPLNASASGKLALAYSEELNIDKLFENLEINKYTNTTIMEKDELLKEIDKIRKDGFSMEKSEVEEGIYCISVPVFKLKNKFIGTISVMGTKEKLSKIKINLSKEMVKVSKELSKELGCL